MIKLKNVGKRSFLVLALCAVILPVVYDVIFSLWGYGSVSGEIRQLSLMSYYEVFLERPDFLVKFWKSLFLTGTIVVGQVIVSLLAGYGFSQYRFPGKEVLFFLVIVMMIMPYQVTLVSNYVVINFLNLQDTYWALILPGIFSPFGVFLMRQAFDYSIKECREAAMVDGAGSIRILHSIMLPQCRNIIASLIVLSFIDNWNMVEQPIVYLRNPYNYPLSVFLSQINGGDIGVRCACGMLALLPVLLLFLYFSDDLVEGISISHI